MAVEKYLRQYAEPEASGIACPPRNWRRVLVIPAYRESGALLDNLDTLLAANPGTLGILVINRPDNDDCSRDLPALVTQRYAHCAPDPGGHWFDAANNCTVLVIDRYSHGQTIPAAQGVGLARKIGCDIACRLIHQGAVNCPWIFSSDADVCWPDDYFDAAPAASEATSALLYPFRHVSAAGIDPLPIQLYEFSLHYYVAGLRWAGSPYAFHTVGSTLAINHRHYARVRGFPRRSGGEDFYILNKLAKTGTVKALRQPALLIKDRASDRVPFGTGPARKRISELHNPLQDYPLYHPNCFADLRRGLARLQQLAASNDPLRLWQETIDHCPPEDSNVVLALQHLGIDKAIGHAAQHSETEAGFQRHLTTWLDGFRTLKLIHGLRDRYYPSIGLNQLLAGESFLTAQLSDPGRLPCKEEITGEALPRINRLLQSYACFEL